MNKKEEFPKENNDAIRIYTDGACSMNPGPGGWGAILLWKGKSKKINGFEAETTNNRMELTAVIEALKLIKRKEKIEVYTDSQYVKNGITIWIEKWRKSAWNKGKVKNIDLWQELDSLNKVLEISWHWVKGHSGDKYNEEADLLARSAIKSRKNEGN